MSSAGTSMAARFNEAIEAGMRDWTDKGKVARFWNRDKTLWTGADEDKWMGWIDIVEKQLAESARFTASSVSMTEVLMPF